MKNIKIILIIGLIFVLLFLNGCGDKVIQNNDGTDQPPALPNEDQGIQDAQINNGNLQPPALPEGE